MYCTNCGKEVKDGLLFCGFCGAKIKPRTVTPISQTSSTVTPQTTQYEQVNVNNISASNMSTVGTKVNSENNNSANNSGMKGEKKSKKSKKKVNKGVIAFICIIFVIVIIGGAVVGYFFRPEARMNNALKSGDIETAYDIYDENLHNKRLSSETESLLTAYIDQIWMEYENGQKMLDEVSADVDKIALFNSDIVSEYLKDSYDRIDSINNINQLLESANGYYANGEYEYALQYYQKVLELDSDSAEAIDRIEKSAKAYGDSLIDRLDSYLDVSDYSSARELVNSTISELGIYDDSDLAAMLDEIDSKFRTEVLEKAEAFKSAGDYDSARLLLNEALNELANDSELEAALTSLEDSKVQGIVDEAYKSADSGDWDSALELLETAQNAYSDNATLGEAYADILYKMPISLRNITVVSSENVEVKDDVVKDRYDNIYDGAVLYDCATWKDGKYQGFGLYNLSGKYTNFSATAFVSTEARNGKDMSISIYIDEILAFYQDGITEETQPINISLDVTEGQTMRVVVTNVGSHSCGYMYFGNSVFTKAEQEV